MSVRPLLQYRTTFSEPIRVRYSPSDLTATMGDLALQAAGAFFSLLGPFRQVYDFLRGLKEKQEVGARLKHVLQPMDAYADSIRASEASGNDLRATVDSLKPPISVQEAESLTRELMEFCDNFRDVLSSVLTFARECNILISDFESFMQKVKTRKPEVYEIMNFFGKHYDPKTHSLDLTNLPTFVRLYGPKIGWKQSDELSKRVAEGGRTVSNAIRIARAISKQRLRIRNRHLVKEFSRSLNKLLKEMTRLKSTKNVARELSRSAPSWILELTEIVEDVQEALPGSSRPAFR